MAIATSSRIPALLLGAVILGLAPRPAPAQDVICCSLLVGMKGDWFGASRQCRQTLEQAKPAQRHAVCAAVGERVCEDVAPFCQPCSGDEARKRDPGGNSLGPGDPVFDGLVDGARNAGYGGFGPHHMGAQARDGRIFFQIRMDADGCPLPNGSCIMQAGEDGHLPPGKQLGGKVLFFGSVQVAGSATRVNGRHVNVETGVIQDAAAATVGGNDRAAIAKAMADMLQKLGVRCRKARGPQF